MRHRSPPPGATFDDVVATDVDEASIGARPPREVQCAVAYASCSSSSAIRIENVASDTKYGLLQMPTAMLTE